MPRTRKAKSEGSPRRVTQRKRKPINLVMGARAHLHYWAKKARANGHTEEAYDLLFASRMILNAWNTGEPDLLVGMFYTPDWRAWRDVTRQPELPGQGIPTAADLDAVAREAEAAMLTEKAEAT